MTSLALALLMQLTVTEAVAAVDPPVAAGGKIVLYRPSSIMGAGVGCPIRYKEKEIVELGRGKFAEFPVPTGRFILTNKTSSVEVIVDPGETRYVRCTIKPGFMTGRADLQIVDAETFVEHQADFERKDVTFQLAR
ncbi:hypothetical protein [Sphingomonas sp. SRS2]|uniref:hypothetical protein n=1 Tax=Sphingomonas sp. SRS2 TaxID=133190 RepID=UPI0006183F0D|nr:hypothetical protein [Sphingomonas sp. SRS2]KKC26330.1 hypothetical protein WP12_09725 [Sphingomonas sp. SRS2]